MLQSRAQPLAEVRRLLGFRPVWLLLALALALNVWGNQWGALNRWHGDELSHEVVELVHARTINPHYFMYGNIAFYRTAVGVVPALAYGRLVDRPPATTDAAAYEAWLERHQARIATWPRFVSAAEGVLLVLATYLIAALLFDRRVGLLAGILLALSPVAVYIAHVATADGFANLAYWLACLAAVLAWRQGGLRWLAAAALLAGVAFGTKTDRLLVLVPVAAAFALHRREGWRHLRLLLLVPVGYAIANPILLLQPFEFLDGLSRDMFFGAVQDPGGTGTYRLLLHYTRTGTGWPIFALAVAGVAYAAICLARGRDRPQLAWLLATFVPYYVVFGSKTVFPWYVGQLLPGLLIVAAYAAVRLADRVPRPLALPARGAVALLVLLGLMGPVSLGLQFTHDPRDAARRWIERSVPPGATLFVSERGPWIRGSRYRVELMLPDRERWTENLATPHDRLESHRLYQRVRSSILASERWAGRTLGTPVRPEPYKGWYDVTLDDLAARPVATERVRQARPDYVVIVEGMSPAVLEWIRAPGSGYAQVAEFRYRSPVSPDLRMPMLNAPVRVFQRRDPGPGGGS
jgi:4-amino-4-deoxy-L-arabinose transferase-like glycosyltransferase